MIIYLDIYFLKNLIFNFLLLYLTSFFIRKKTKWYRLLIASILGSLYAVIALYFKNIFQSNSLKIIVALYMLIITYGKKHITNVMSSFFILTYFIAGFIASILDIEGQVVLILFAVFILSLFYSYQRENKTKSYYDIEIYLMGVTVELKAKLDTGNELKDNMFGRDVIIVTEESIKKDFKEDLIHILRNERLIIPEQYRNRIKLITFQTIAGEGIKIGIKIDRIIINIGNEKVENQAILILSDKKFKGYDALIGPNILEGAFQYHI